MKSWGSYNRNSFVNGILAWVSFVVLTPVERSKCPAKRSKTTWVVKVMKSISIPSPPKKTNQNTYNNKTTIKCRTLKPEKWPTDKNLEQPNTSTMCKVPGTVLESLFLTKILSKILYLGYRIISIIYCYIMNNHKTSRSILHPHL